MRNAREFVRLYATNIVSTLALLSRLVDSSAVSTQLAARTRAVVGKADSLLGDLAARFPVLKTQLATGIRLTQPLFLTQSFMQFYTSSAYI